MPPGTWLFVSSEIVPRKYVLSGHYILLKNTYLKTATKSYRLLPPFKKATPDFKIFTSFLL